MAVIVTLFFYYHTARFIQGCSQKCTERNFLSKSRRHSLQKCCHEEIKIKLRPVRTELFHSIDALGKRRGS